MASYFDEHDCQPLASGQSPDHLMHMARLLVDTGAWNETEFAAMFEQRTPPPASKEFLESLDDILIRNECEFVYIFTLLFLARCFFFPFLIFFLWPL